jgi:hypothetical protein
MKHTKQFEDFINENNPEIANEAKNPEGDKMVLDFLKKVAKEYDYPVAHAVLFVKETIKKLGY